MESFDFESKLLAIEAMLDRRGYELALPVFPNTEVWTVYRQNGTEPLIRITTELLELIDLPKFPRLCDDQLAAGMHHMQHWCGYPLLRAVEGKTTHFYSYRSAFVGPYGPTLLECPQCQQYVQEEHEGIILVEEIVDPEIMEPTERSVVQ